LASELHLDPHGADGYTFKSLGEHVDEVRMLLKSEDVHWRAETADIIIHALMLLVRHGVPPQEIDEIIGRRIGRFDEKITAALADKKRKTKFRDTIYGKEDPGC